MERAESRTEPAVERFIDKHEVSRRLMTSVRTVEYWMRDGRLPYYKLGVLVRFKWSEVEQHLGRHCRICPSTPAKP